MNKTNPPPPQNLRHKQQGFTLIEVMVASVMGLFIIAVSLTFLNQAAHMADIMDTRMRLNSQARDFMRLVSGGGGNLNEIMLSGLYGSADVSGAATINLNASNLKNNSINTFAVDGQRYVLSGLDSGAGFTGAITFGTDEANVGVACTANNTPHQDCVGTNTLNVNGYLNGPPEIVSAGEFAPTTPRHCSGGLILRRSTLASVKWNLIDPFRLQRSNEFIAEETNAHFTTMVGMLVDCQP